MIIFTTLIYWIIHILKYCKTIVSYLLSSTEEGEREIEIERDGDRDREEGRKRREIRNYFISRDMSCKKKTEKLSIICKNLITHMSILSII